MNARHMEPETLAALRVETRAAFAFAERLRHLATRAAAGRPRYQGASIGESKIDNAAREAGKVAERLAAAVQWCDAMGADRDAEKPQEPREARAHFTLSGSPLCTCQYPANYDRLNAAGSPPCSDTASRQASRFAALAAQFPGRVALVAGPCTAEVLEATR